jgi:hypothetical protein
MAKKLSTLPVGALVKDTLSTYKGAHPIFRVLEHGHTGDPSGSTTLDFRDIICLKAFDAKEPNNPNSDRKNYGNNRYLYSNILQWLNSTAAGGSWYSAQHTYDQAPTPKSNTANYNEYASEAGFLSFMSAQFRAALKTVSKTTVKNTVTDGGGSEAVSSKIFLLSTTEVGLANESSIAEGSVYSYYSSGGNNGRKKNLMNDAAKGDYTSATSPWFWWLRTPHASNSYGVRVVGAGGTLFSDYAYTGNYGVAPAFCVSSDLVVSDTTDTDGAYTILWNAAPTVTPTSHNYGSISSPPAITVEVVDADGDAYTGVVKLNGTQKQTFSGTGTGSHTLDMDAIWAAATINASNSLVVTVTDTASNVTTVTYTFTKTNSAPAAPTITNLANNRRIPSAGYVNFTIGSDPEGNHQSVKLQASANSSFASPTEYTALEKLVDGEWESVTNDLTNDDVGSQFRIGYTGLTAGAAVYIRVGSTDTGSSSTAYSTVYTVKGGDVLEIISKIFDTDERPRVATAIVNKTIAAGATTELFITNNANDASPVWESYTEGSEHQFENDTKTAASWGVAVKVKVTAGTATGEISVSAIAVGVL